MNEHTADSRKIHEALMQLIEILAIRVADEIVEEHRDSKQKENRQSDGAINSEDQFNNEKQ